MDKQIIIPEELDNTVVTMCFGSHLYGLNTPASDFDFKSIFLPPPRDIILDRVTPEVTYSTGDNGSKNGKGDLDISRMTLQHFLKNAISGQTWALDMLHANQEHLLVDSEIWQDIQANRDKFYTKNIRSFVGYVKTQAAKYGIKGSRLAAMKEALVKIKYSQKVVTELHGALSASRLVLSDIWSDLPENQYLSKVIKEADETHETQAFYEICGKKYQATNLLSYVIERVEKMYDSYGHRAKLAEQNEGVDWKAISHAFRAAYQAKEIYESGTITYPLAKRERLLAIKLGQLDYKTEVAPALEDLVNEVDILSSRSNLREEVDTKFWDNFLIDWYEQFYNLSCDGPYPDGTKVRTAAELIGRY